MPNRLADQTSPYLLQHANNPVEWYPWGPEALQRAREQDRPIFLSIGYSACHWCHVMERESFEDAAIAEQINRDFVAIKVDREERPDLDDVYMAAVQAMTGGGGWPMTVFLTPQLEPFFGGTYFPPQDRHGLPGLPRLLDAVAEAYRDRRDDVRSQGSQLVAHVRQQLEVRPGSVDPQAQQLQVAAARLASTFDGIHGGFGGAPKFPAPMTLEFLLRVWHRSRDDEMRRVVAVTLDRMADGGIFDHLAGGFARYSTDAEWLVPHFEKMLYDNAQLAHCYLEAHRVTGDERYAAVAGATLDFMIRELQTDDGGFASALDADSEDEEGRFYTWSQDEFMAGLAAGGVDYADRHSLADYWGVTAGGNWEGRNILHRARRPVGAVPTEAPDDALLDRSRAALLAVREGRVRPGRDDKQLAAWNGMALRALSAGFLVLGDERYLAAGRALASFLRRRLLRDGHLLWRTARGDTAHTPGFAEDYANVADGLLALFAAGGEAADLLDAVGLMRRAIEVFWDEESGTLFDTGPEHDASFARPRSLIDSATPAANSVAADVLLRLALITGDADLDRRARRILRAVAPAIERQPSAFGRMLCSIDRALADPVDAVVVADPASAEGVALRRAVARPYAPDLVIAPRDQTADLAAYPLFEGKEARDGEATAYVCQGYACEEPTTDPERAAAQVSGLAAPLTGPTTIVRPAGS